MNIKVMIIDAHPVYAPKTAGFLGSLTFKDVLIVPSGLKAMEAVTAYKPGIIVLSATLPDADSVVLARQIKSNDPSIAMIVQTGLLITPEATQAFKSAGVEHIIPRREKDWSAFEEALTSCIS